MSKEEKKNALTIFLLKQEGLSLYEDEATSFFTFISSLAEAPFRNGSAWTSKSTNKIVFISTSFSRKRVQSLTLAKIQHSNAIRYSYWLMLFGDLLP